MVNSGFTNSKQSDGRFPVVGLCASAGGLDAYQTFFKAMSPESGMAFVVVQHLHPGTESILTALLQRYTQMPVHSITNNIAVQPNHVYVVLPGEEVSFWDGELQVNELNRSSGWPNIIDRFLRSLARDQGDYAAAVILSGAGQDGMEGARTIKANHGLVIAQTPESALHKSMPLHVIQEELADAVLPPAQIPAYLFEHFTTANPVSSFALDRRIDTITQEDVTRILRRLRRLTGHDFTDYRAGALKQQVIRRMTAFRCASVDEYLDYLDETPEEAEHLERYLFIHVTRFFRDAAAFEALKTKALLPLLQQMDIDTTFRAWVPGCASGEEAISIAILIHECLQELGMTDMDIRIFATDASEEMIRHARKGMYPASIAGEISETRLQQHFEEVAQGYRVREHINRMLLWTPHNLVEHPPFSNLHLVSCRNVLIYFQGRLRHRVFSMLQYSLLPEGILFLGTSESVPEDWTTIMPVDSQHRIYRQEADVRRRWVNMDQPLFAKPPRRGRTDQPPAQTDDDRYRALMQDPLIAHYNTTCAIVDEAFQVKYTRGDIDRYLRVSPGFGIEHSLLKLARGGLDAALTLVLHQSFKTGESVVRQNVTFQSDDWPQSVDLIVRPLTSSASGKKQRLLIFEVGSAQDEYSDRESPVAEDEATSIPVRAELMSELHSAYEQVQMQNEELETSNEEMQTLNEELNTINNQLIVRNDELAYAHNTLHNILQYVEISMVFLDLDLIIRDYTRVTAGIFNLKPDGDNPSLETVDHTLRDVDLITDANAVLNTLKHIEKEVQAEDGRWYIMRIRPYRTTKNIIDGLVLTFSDITRQKVAQVALQHSEQQQRELASRLEKEHRRLATVLKHLPVGVWITDADGRVIYTTPLSDSIWSGTAPHVESSEYLARYPTYDAETGDPLPLEDYPLMKALRTRQRVPWTKLKIRRFDDSSAFIMVLANPIWNANKQLIGAVAIAQDVTDPGQEPENQ